MFVTIHETGRSSRWAALALGVILVVAVVGTLPGGAAGSPSVGVTDPINETDVSGTETADDTDVSGTETIDDTDISGTEDGTNLSDGQPETTETATATNQDTRTPSDTSDQVFTNDTDDVETSLDATADAIPGSGLTNDILGLAPIDGHIQYGANGSHPAHSADDDRGTVTPERATPSESGSSVKPANESGAAGTDGGPSSQSDGRSTGGRAPLPDAPDPLPTVLGIGGLGAMLVTTSRFSDGMAAGILRDSVGGGVHRRLAVGLARVPPLFGLAGYQRYEDDDPLVHETRAAIYSQIQSEPGIYLSALTEATGTPMGTVRYHLKILEFEGIVRRTTSNGRRRYYPIDVDPGSFETLLDDSAAQAVLTELGASGPTPVGELADRVDRDPSTITHHTTRLAEMGLVERKRSGRSTLNRLTDEGRASLPGPHARVSPSEAAPASRKGHSAGD